MQDQHHMLYYIFSFPSQTRKDGHNSLGHDSNLFCFRNTTSVSNVRLDEVDTASFKVWSDIKTSEKSFPKLNKNS